MAEVRSILINAWDPIDVRHITHLTDEYDAYIGSIIKILLAGCTSLEIELLFQSIEDKENGCGTNKAVRHNVANKLQSLYIQGIHQISIIALIFGVLPHHAKTNHCFIKL